MKLLLGGKQTPVITAFQSNAGSLRNFLRRFFECSEDVEDLLQETFVRTFEAEHSTGIDMPKAFLFKTARNLALNELTRRARHKTQAVADIDSLTVLLAQREQYGDVLRLQPTETIDTTVQVSTVETVVFDGATIDLLQTLDLPGATVCSSSLMSRCLTSSLKLPATHRERL